MPIEHSKTEWRKNPTCVTQVGFVLKYKLGRSGLATDCGAGTGRWLVYTSKLPRNRWKIRSAD